MPKTRFSKRLNITMEARWIRQMDAAAEDYGVSRSELIRLALRDWLERHPLSPAATEKKQVKPLPEIDPEKSFNQLIKPGMSGEEITELFRAYDAATRYRV